MSQNDVAMVEWPSEARLGRTRDRDCWYPEQSCEMHCAGIVRQQQMALAQLLVANVPQS
jgi:hypothetical protein